MPNPLLPFLQLVRAPKHVARTKAAYVSSACLLRCVIILTWLGGTCVGQEINLPNPFDYLPAEPNNSTVQPSNQDNSEPAPLDQATAHASPENQKVDLPSGASAESAAEVSANSDLSDLREDHATTQDSDVPSIPDNDAVNDVKPRDQNADQFAAAPPGIANRNFAPADELLGKKFSKAMLIEANGPIFGKFHWYLNNRLDLAKKQNADLVIVRLTSPGGDMEASLQLARRLRDIDWAETMVLIPEEAISGGAIISLGADRIYMINGALIGDAGPIKLGMEGFEHADEKIVSYLSEALHELAEGKGRPGAIAEAMADRNLKVYEATEVATGRQVYISEHDREKADFAERVRIGPPVAETGQNRFLTVGAERAMELQLCEGVFASEKDFLNQVTVTDVVRTELNWVDNLVYLLNRPWLTALLLIAGLVGLYIELAAPGISVAGLSSLVCFGIFFWSHALGGTSGWLEVLLFLLGVICVVCELFVLPGFGIFGISGLLLLVLSLVMASQDFVIPENATQWSQLRVNALIVLGSVLGALVALFLQVILLDSIPGLNRFRLAAPEVEFGNEPVAITGLTQSMQSNARSLKLGMFGVAESDLRPSGKVRINDQLVDVVTEGDYVDAATPVEVIRVEGPRVTVRVKG